MPQNMTENENPLSLISIEVLVNQIQVDLNIECHLPCIVFRLLDYPAVSIPYFDEWQIKEFHNLKRDNPKLSWRQLLSEQFYELRSANGKFNFKRGKSCLFKIYFKTLYAHLLNVPLFLLLIDQINDKDFNANTTQFIGSCNLKLNELIEILNQSIIKNGTDVPLVEQQTFQCALFNLMGTHIGTCDVAVRFCHYGTTILTHLPMLNDGLITKPDETVTTTKKEQVKPSSEPPVTDTIVKHIHLVNEKKEVPLQISRTDFPPSKKNDKSAQTRWTSTKSHPLGHEHCRGPYVRTLDDPSLDDPLISCYQPPPLYFNADSDFLHMITPATTKHIDQAKENRLSYLASIPIAVFNDDYDDNDDKEKRTSNKQPLKPKSSQNVRFNLPSSSSISVPQQKLIPQLKLLPKEFLSNFPLLRALVEEALTLQEHQQNVHILNRHTGSSERSHSAEHSQYEKQKEHLVRPKSAVNVRPIRTKSVIIPKTKKNTRRLYPPPPDSKQMIVTKDEVRSLVDRLSKPKFNKQTEREMALLEQAAVAGIEIVSTPRSSSKPTSFVQPLASHRPVVSQKPPPSYGTTRAHRLYTEYSRARRKEFEKQTTTPQKSPRSPRKESTMIDRMLPASPQLINTGTLSNFSLLNKVDIVTATIERNSSQKDTLDPTRQRTGPTMKSSSTSYDASKGLNQTSPLPSLSPSTDTSPSDETPSEPNRNNEEVKFSITDVTDYFTDGDNASSTRPSVRQST